MLRGTVVAVGAMLLFALNSCGGGSGNILDSDRIGSYQFTPGDELTVQDPVSKMQIRFGRTALAQAERITVVFADSSTVKPASPVVHVKTTAMISVSQQFAADAIHVEYPIGTANPVELIGMQEENALWRANVPTVDQSRRIITFTMQPNLSRGGRAIHTQRIAVAQAPFQADFSEQTVDLVLLAGSGTPDRITSPGAALLIHGMNNTTKDMKRLAYRLVDDHRFTAVYGLAYPWAKDLAITAADLAQLIKTRTTSGIRITVIAHSMGGLIACYAIERLHCSDFVDSLILVGVPRQGAAAAGNIKRCEGQASQNLNNPEDTADNWAGLCSLDTSSVRQLIPGSSLLADLNGPAVNHTNYVPYQVIAGTSSTWLNDLGTFLCSEPCDGLVEKSSVTDFSYEEKATLGAVIRHAWTYNHSELITHPAALGLLSLTVKDNQNTLGAIVNGQAENPTATDRGWDVTLNIANPLIGFGTSIDFLVMQAFDRYGSWTTTQWYDARTGLGQFFPVVPNPWHELLQSRQSFSIPMHLDFDFDRHQYGETAVKDQAKTVVLICTGTLTTGEPFTATSRFIVKDQAGQGPSGPPRLATIQSTRQSPGALFRRR